MKIQYLLPEIILVNTQLPENLGAVSRCMLNFNFNKLRIVNPKFDLGNEKILPVSAGADRVINKIKKFENLTSCIKNFNLVIATSNRIRSIKKKEITIEEIANILKKKKVKTAIVFGPEKSGLDNNDLSLCDYSLKIESNPVFSSLNLSHAVAVICQNLRNSLFKVRKNYKFNENENIAKKEELFLLYSILENRLDSKKFFRVRERKKITLQKIKNIFSKSILTSEVVRIIISIIKSLSK